MFEDLNWEDGDAAHFSAWLLPMLVTNPQARATAAQSACHPFLEPMDLEEGEMLGISSSSSSSSALGGGVLGDKVDELEEQMVKIEARCVGEVSRLEAKVEQVVEAKGAETNLVSKLKAEVADLKTEKEVEKTATDALKQRLVILENKFEKLAAEESLKSKELTTRLEEQKLAVEELKQKYIIHLDDGQVMEKEEVERVKLASGERNEEVNIGAKEEDCNKTFICKKPLPKPAVVPSTFPKFRKSQEPLPMKAVTDSKAQLKGGVNTCKRKQIRSELRELEAFEKSDLENNAHAEQYAVKAEAKEHPTKKKSLVEMMQKKLNCGQDLTRTKSRASPAFEVLEKVATDSEVVCTQLVVSNIKVPCSIVAQTKLLLLVKRTGTLVKYRFSE